MHIRTYTHTHTHTHTHSHSHIQLVTALKSSTRLLCEMYYAKSANKILYMRSDIIARILTAINAHSNSRLIAVETAQGLLITSLLERLGGKCYAHVQSTYVHTHTCMHTCPRARARTHTHSFFAFNSIIPLFLQVLVHFCMFFREIDL